MNTETLLMSIGSTEETSFKELCNALGSDCPEPGDKAAWRELFEKLRELERDGLIEVSKLDGRIESLILTEAGANKIRDKLDARRELLSLL